MGRVIVKSKVGSDGTLHLDLPLGAEGANQEVQITVEPAQTATKVSKTHPRACDILSSGLVGMWADRTDIGDSREFARRLRQEGETRRRNP
jgi:hypothetical protein